MKIKKRKKNQRVAFFRDGVLNKDKDIHLDGSVRIKEPQRRFTGNVFRDAMLNNRGITTNQ